MSSAGLETVGKISGNFDCFISIVVSVVRVFCTSRKTLLESILVLMSVDRVGSAGAAGYSIFLAREFGSANDV